MAKPTVPRPMPIVTIRLSPRLLRRLAAVSTPCEATDLMNAADAVARGEVHAADGNTTGEGMRYGVRYEPKGGIDPCP